MKIRKQRTILLDFEKLLNIMKETLRISRNKNSSHRQSSGFFKTGIDITVNKESMRSNDAFTSNSQRISDNNVYVSKNN